MKKLKKAQSCKRTTRKKQKHINKKTKRGGANTRSVGNNLRGNHKSPDSGTAASAAMNRADKFPTRTGGRVFVFIMAPIAAMATLSLLLNG